MHQIPCKTECDLHFGTEGVVAYRNSKCGLKIYVYEVMFNSENEAEPSSIWGYPSVSYMESRKMEKNKVRPEGIFSPIC
jgi:hypothetical protein